MEETVRDLKAKEVEMRRKALLTYLVLAVVLLAGCGQSPYFYENTVIDPQGWPGGEPVTYTFDIDDTTEPFNFVMNLRHGDDYPYSNLFLFVQLDFPNGKTSVDTLECVLADPTGRWNGRKTGQLVDHRIMLNSRRIFPMEGSYNVHIRQAMRNDPLPGIHDVGFSLERWQPE